MQSKKDLKRANENFLNIDKYRLKFKQIFPIKSKLSRFSQQFYSSVDNYWILLRIAYLIKICIDIFQKNFPSVVLCFFFLIFRNTKNKIFLRGMYIFKVSLLNNVKDVKIYIYTDFCV